MDKFKIGDRVKINVLDVGEVVDVLNIPWGFKYKVKVIKLIERGIFYELGEIVEFREEDLEPTNIVNVQQVFKNWCKQTKRSGGVLVGSSIQEFLRELQAKVDERQ